MEIQEKAALQETSESRSSCEKEINKEEDTIDTKPGMIAVGIDKQETEDEDKTTTGTNVEEQTVVGTGEENVVDDKEMHVQGAVGVENEKEKQGVKVENSSVELGSRSGGLNNPVLSMLMENQPEIDNIIEEVAKRRNLTVLNVKSILRHVLKDKRVLALAEKKAAEAEGTVSSKKWNMDEIITFEPKLTRSRVRQELETHGGISQEELASLTNMIKMKSPLKKRSKSATVRSRKTSQEGSVDSDSSSDEEYSPAREESRVCSDDDDDNDETTTSDEEEDDHSVSSDEEDGKDMAIGEGEEEDKEEEEGEEEVGDDEDEEDEVMEEEEEEEEDFEADDGIGEGGEETDDEEGVEEMDAEVQELAGKKSNVCDPIENVTDSTSTDNSHSSLDVTFSTAVSASTVSGSATVTCAGVSVSASSLLTSSTTSKSTTETLSSQIPPTSPGLVGTASFSTKEAPHLSASTAATADADTHTTSNFSQHAHQATPVAPRTAIITPSSTELVSSCSTITSSVQISTNTSSSLAQTNSQQPALTSPSHTSPSDATMISPLPSPPAGFTESTAPLLSPIRSPLHLKSSNSLVPPPDRNLIYETAALLASMSDPSQSPMKGLMSGSPFKVDAAQTNSAAKSNTSASLPRQGPANLPPSTLVSGLSQTSQYNETTCSEQPAKVSQVRFSCIEQMQDDKGLTEQRIMESCSEIPDVSATAASSQFDVASPPEFSEFQEGEIARRTRSKLPLNDTSMSAIEAMLVPPDDEDPATPSERAESVTMEEDDVEWQMWLGDLFSSDSPSGANDSITSGCGEDDGDTEYSFPVDQVDDEREEFRNDRAVKISKKEVDELLNEYLYPSATGVDGLLSTDGLDLTSAYLLQSLGLQNLLMQGTSTTNTSYSREVSSQSSTQARFLADSSDVEKEVYLTSKQTVQLGVQIQQHYQLLMQTFLLSRFEPTLVHVAQLAAQAVKELRQLKFDAKTESQSALWTIPHFEDGIKLINRLDPHKEDAVDLIPASGNPCRISDAVKDIFMSSHIFWMFPQFLPSIGFGSLLKEKQPNCNYTQEEDCLLVMGMDHYGRNNWKAIHENLLPVKTPKQLNVRVKNSCAKRSGDNVIKHYKKTNEVLIPYTKKEGGDGKKKRTSENDLPDWVMNYFEKREDKKEAKKESKKKEKASESAATKSLDASITKLLQLSGEAIDQLKNSSSRGASGAGVNTKNDKAYLKPLLPVGIPATKGVSSSAIGVADTIAQAKRNLAHASSSVPKRAKLNDSSSGDRVVKTLEESLLRASFDAAASQALSTGSLSESNMDILLHAAGLEASSFPAKYAYRYLGEVKACLLGEDGMKRYDQFLEVLVRGCKQNLPPSQIYNEVKVILQPWPHLVQLFTEFLTPEDCIRANAMEDKCQVNSVKSFMSRLEDKFQDSPMEIDHILNTLLSLDAPGVTKQQVFSKMFPLLEAHRDLVMELKKFLYQLAPAPESNSIFDDVSAEASDQAWDQFENVTFGTTSVGANSLGKFGVGPSSSSHFSSQVFPHSQHSRHGPSPLAKSWSPASSKSGSSRPSKRSSKSQGSDSSQLSGIVSLQQQHRPPPQKRLKTGHISSPITASKKSSYPQSERRSFGEASCVSKRRVPFKQRENQQAIPASSVNPCSERKKAGEDRVSGHHSDPSVKDSEDMGCESVKGVVTFRLGGVDGTSSLQSNDSHTFMSLMSVSQSQKSCQMHTSPLCSSHPSSSPGDRSLYEAASQVKVSDVGTSQEALQQDKAAVSANATFSSPASSLSCQETRSPQVKLASLTPKLSSPTHSTPKSLASTNSLTPSSGKILTRRTTNGAHRQPATPTRHSNGWTREEDRVILKSCLHATMKLPDNSKYFGEIALQLQRDPDEIKSRYEELFKLYQSKRSKDKLSLPT